MKKLFYFLLFISYGCTNRNEVPGYMSEILSESNQQLNLREVISYYQSTGDSLKLEAAYFLLQNMPGLGTEYVVIDSDSGMISYNDYLKIGKRPDTLDAFYESKFIEDNQQISSKYLIDNIESAFAIWENTKWKDEINFQEFCEYLLPYRVGYEIPENWRDSVYQQYQWVSDSIKKHGSLTKICTLINNDIRSWSTYANTQHTSDLLLSFSELYKTKTGSCLAFTNINAFAMRTFGVPVMIDFVPYWADANGGHAWNSVFIDNKLFGLLWETGLSNTQALFPFDKSGNIISHTFRRSGKVYRRTFGIEKTSLAEICTNKNNIPLLFRNSRIKDVTKEYMPVSDVRIKLPEKFNQTDYVYLCVFNNGHWEGIQWSNISSNSRTTFKNMGRDIIYLVSQYKDGRYIPVSLPFHLSTTGEISFLKANPNKLINLIAEKRSNDVYISYPEYAVVPGKSYLLYLWKDDDWTLLEKKTATSDTIAFNHIPDGGLYRLKMYDSDGRERIFLYKENKQVWM